MGAAAVQVIPTAVPLMAVSAASAVVCRVALVEPAATPLRTLVFPATAAARSAITPLAASAYRRLLPLTATVDLAVAASAAAAPAAKLALMAFAATTVSCASATNLRPQITRIARSPPRIPQNLRLILSFILQQPSVPFCGHHARPLPNTAITAKMPTTFSKR